MERSALREAPQAPTLYKSFRLVQVGDSWYADPGRPPEDDLDDPALLARRPDILSAPTREALEARPQVAGEFEGYTLVRSAGRVYGVPPASAPEDLEEVLSRAGLFTGATCDEVRERIRAHRAARSVEFAGWLPVFKRFGDCGT